MAWELLYCTRVLLYASVYNMYYYAKEKGEGEGEKKDEQREKKLQNDQHNQSTTGRTVRVLQIKSKTKQQKRCKSDRAENSNN